MSQHQMHLGADLHMGSEIHHVEDNDLSRDMAASLGFSPSPNRPLRKGKLTKIVSRFRL